MAKKIVPLAMRNPSYLNTFGPMKPYLEARVYHEFLHLKVNDNILTKIRPLGTEDLYHTPGIDLSFSKYWQKIRGHKVNNGRRILYSSIVV